MTDQAKQLKENHRRTKKGLGPKPPTEEEDDGSPGRKDPQEEGSKTGGREGERQKTTNAEEPKRHAHDKEGEGGQKTPKGNCSGPKDDPVAEGTGDSTEAEELPETNRKTQEQER